MNERIAEIIKLATSEDRLQPEEFAELIIRDVTETAAKFRQSKTRPVGWNFRATVLNEYGLKEND